jgi:hypothetical protein
MGILLKLQLGRELLRWPLHTLASDRLGARVGAIDNTHFVGIKSNMDAELLLRKRLGFSETAFVEILIWQVPKPVHGSAHSFKYLLALVAESVCVLRYDNEAGKGDHKHVGDREAAYRFTDLDGLQADFWQDVEN